MGGRIEFLPCKGKHDAHGYSSQSVEVGCCCVPGNPSAELTSSMNIKEAMVAWHANNVHTHPRRSKYSRTRTRTRKQKKVEMQVSCNSVPACKSRNDAKGGSAADSDGMVSVRCDCTHPVYCCSRACGSCVHVNHGRQGMAVSTTENGTPGLECAKLPLIDRYA